MLELFLYDGTSIVCDTLEFSTDGKYAILDGTRLIELIKIIRIRVSY